MEKEEGSLLLSVILYVPMGFSGFSFFYSCLASQCLVFLYKTVNDMNIYDCSGSEFQTGLFICLILMMNQRLALTQSDFAILPGSI